MEEPVRGRLTSVANIFALDRILAAWHGPEMPMLDVEHARARFFDAAGFDLAPLQRVLADDEYRPGRSCSW